MNDSQPDSAASTPPGALASLRQAATGRNWAAAIFGVVSLAIVGWALATEWGGVAHSHPAYAISLGVLAGCSVLGLIGLRRKPRQGGWRRLGRGALLGSWAIFTLALGWARPHSAVEPALAAMASDDVVSVAESSTQIVMLPTQGNSDVGLIFQPGALVDPRAYATTLRPLAEAGHPVVIIKQPFGIAFFAMTAAERVPAEHPEVASWVVGGHSLGGTVAAIEANSNEDGTVAGLLLWASYPAGDISDTLGVPVMSVSGSMDGLATPTKIAESKPNLPAATSFVAIEGASHAQFGSYGTQAGDLTPTISSTAAQEQIDKASLGFIESLDG